MGVILNNFHNTHASKFVDLAKRYDKKSNNLPKFKLTGEKKITIVQGFWKNTLIN